MPCLGFIVIVKESVMTGIRTRVLPIQGQEPYHRAIEACEVETRILRVILEVCSSFLLIEKVMSCPRLELMTFQPKAQSVTSGPRRQVAALMIILSLLL